MFRLALLLTLLASASAHARPLCRDVWPGGAYRPAAGESYSSFRARTQRPSCEKDWTVLVYLAADNDLFPHALVDLHEMEGNFVGAARAGSTRKTDLVVQVNGAGESRRLHIFQAEERYRPAEAGDLTSLDEIHAPRAGVGEPGDEETKLTAFLRWAAAEYPSRHYLVVAWGHGQGWRAFPSGGSRELDTPALRRALAAFHRASGRSADVFASDSCLMQMLEVAHELSDDARFVVGSTQVQSYQGFPYRRLLYELNSGRFDGQRAEARAGVDAGDEAFLLAKMIPSLTKESLDPARGSQGSSDPSARSWMTASALSSTEANNLLVPALTRLGAALTAFLREDSGRGLDLQLVLSRTPSLAGGAQDLGVFVGLLDGLLRREADRGGALSPAASALQRETGNAAAALDRSVVSYAFGDSYASGPTGARTGLVPRALSLWLPSSEADYRARREEFLRSRFYSETRWSAWLDVLYP